MRMVQRPIQPPPGHSGWLFDQPEWYGPFARLPLQSVTATMNRSAVEGSTRRSCGRKRFRWWRRPAWEDPHPKRSLALSAMRSSIRNAILDPQCDPRTDRRLTLPGSAPDYVDLCQIHRFDPNTPVEETMEARRPAGEGCGLRTNYGPDRPNSVHVHGRQRTSMRGRSRSATEKARSGGQGVAVVDRLRLAEDLGPT
jgi:hypothetical protein